MDRGCNAETAPQLGTLASKSSSRLRLSGDWSRVNLANPDPSTLSTRLVDRKESSQIDVSEQCSDVVPPSKTRLSSTTTVPVPAKPEAQTLSIPPSLVLPTRSRTIPITTHNQRSPFLAILPHDVHYILAVEYLDFDTLLALRQTCRTMYDILSSELVHRVRSDFVQKSLDIEIKRFRDYRTIYPRQRLGALWDLLYAAFDFRLIERPAKELRCYGCLEVKPLWCFVERMSNKGTGLGAKSARDRVCKDCMRRYRDVEGQWWKENWVKKSDTVRKASRRTRVKRWALEGQSLLNPEEEIGVCSCCGSGTFELWWGCVACFELEEKRRREEDLMEYAGLERKIIDVVESWRARKEAKRRAQQATRERRSQRRWLPKMNLNLHWEGGVAERKAALLEWKDRRSQNMPIAGYSKKTFVTRANREDGDQEPRWRAIEQTPLPKSRREARCSSCWVPNCPRRTYILGLAYERPLPRERWCSGCQQDFECRHAKKRDVKRRRKSPDRDDGGIFSASWDDGFGTLFDES
jgi:hypothetical protein